MHTYNAVTTENRDTYFMKLNYLKKIPIYVQCTYTLFNINGTE